MNTKIITAVLAVWALAGPIVGYQAGKPSYVDQEHILSEIDYEEIKLIDDDKRLEVRISLVKNDGYKLQSTANVVGKWFQDDENGVPVDHPTLLEPVHRLEPRGDAYIYHARFEVPAKIDLTKPSTIHWAFDYVRVSDSEYFEFQWPDIEVPALK